MKTKVLTRAMMGVAALAIAIPTVAQVTKARYGALLVDALAPERVPRPLRQLLAHALA